MMKKNNLYTFQNRVTNIVILFLFIGIVFFIISYSIIFYLNRKISITEYKQNIENTNKILQYNIASQLFVIANNPDFIDYLRSGVITREREFYKIRWLFVDLEPRNLISGISITDAVTGTILLIFGNSSKYYTKLNLCYLNNKINFHLGNCSYFIKLFFNRFEYQKQLQNLNANIVFKKNKNDYFYNPFSEKFGNFKSNNYSLLNIEFQTKYKFPYFLVLSLITLIIIFIIILFYCYKFLQNQINKDLFDPILYIIKGLDENVNLLKKNNILEEFNNLIDVVNRYNTIQINTRLSKVVARVAHDIKSPLTVIELTISEFINKSDSKSLIVKNAVKSVRAIVNNMLCSYSNKNKTDSIYDNTKSYVLIADLIEEIVTLKKVEWLANNQTFNLDYQIENVNHLWIYLNFIEFKRHISNVLQNSYEAQRLSSIDIKLRLLEINNTFIVEIQDNGVGMNSKTIELVKHGISFKPSGFGIGLESAINYFRQENSVFEIQSKEGVGTTISIFINVSENPNWYSELISVKEELLILDNEITILEYWKNKVSILNLKVNIFLSPNNFLDYYETIENDNNITFIIDYDLNDNLNGLDIINTIKNKKDCYLITNNYMDYSIQQKVKEYNCKLIPKGLISKISIFKNNYS